MNMTGLGEFRVGLTRRRRDNCGVTYKYPYAYQHRAHSVRTKFLKFHSVSVLTSGLPSAQPPHSC
jgi:hypothetical protein